MIEINNKIDYSIWLEKSKNSTIGFVPTMGALHKGHISLVEKSLIENDYTVVSIFVNPTQFNNKNDFINYPITIENDRLFLNEINCDVLFLPSVQEMYENNLESSNFIFSGIEKVMEGTHRPGHFNGVATIVNKLFKIIKPTIAYFGEKDFQQLLIIKELVELYKLPIQIKGMPIFREPNGLAMSSRNSRLTTIQREKSSIIYETLLKVKKMYFSSVSLEYIFRFVENEFSTTEFKLEYFEIRENKSLKLANQIIEKNMYRAFISVFIGEIRLIDNIALF